MAFKDLDLNQMVALFSVYVNDAAMKKTFLSIPEIAGLYAKVEAAYQSVLSVRPPEVIADPVIAEISGLQREVDRRHDCLARAVGLFLEAHRERARAEDPPDEERAAACDAAHAAILPEGTSITLASYRAEAGNTERLERLLAEPTSADIKTVLKSIAVKKGETVLDTAELWIAAGAELGKLETKKVARAAALQGEPPPPLRVIQGARSQWIKVASLLVQAAELSDAPAARAAVVHPLVDAADRAGQRTARRGTPAEPASPGEPAAAPVTEPG